MPKAVERTSLGVQSERAVVAAVRLPDSKYDHSDPFGELRSLAEQAGATVVGELSQTLVKPVSGTYMGSGKVEELGRLCEALNASTIIFDHDLSPKQISKIEEVTKRKVIDRSELILDIFALRAVTSEAKLQVELAQQEYTYPRLRAMWSHLERIVGGIGTRGPGEQQLEIDRRLVQARRQELLGELRDVQARRRREVRARKREHFTVGLVGYTNAGKSTLFNTLTLGGAYADDRLFATLMTRTREWTVESGLRVMLSDTVGFVRDIPHHLVASFKATLEEATHADVLLIVLDVADPTAELQYNTVTHVLDELLEEVAKEEAEEGSAWTPPRRIVLLNKVDRLPDNSGLLVWQKRLPDAMAISAIEGKPGRLALGHDELATRIAELARGPLMKLRITIPLADSKAVTQVEGRSRIIDRVYDERENVTLHVEMGTLELERLRAGGVRMKIEGEALASPAWKPA